MRPLLSVIAFVLAVFAVVLPASAGSERIGTPAWSNSALVVRDGPGFAYDVTGQLPTDIAIKVLRCQRKWCVVDAAGVRGWTGKDDISFGKTPTDWPGGIHPDYPHGGSACFFTGTNYTGASFCVSAGRVIDDLALLNLDNTFASVKVYGSSIAACRDRFFGSYCERIVASQPVLDQYLVRNLSSIRAY